MKKNLLLSSLLIFLVTLTVQAQSIISYDYGEGLAFPINQSASFDFDEDGATDLMINTQPDKLSIRPIFLNGCVLSNTAYDTDVNGLRVRVLNEGDPVYKSLEYENGIHFEEDEPLPIYGGEGNTYADWEDGEAKYIGLLSWLTGAPGWMKIRVDTETETLYILSYAYSTIQDGEILAGELQEMTVDVPEIKSINDIFIYPNPATSQLSVELELEAASNVSFTLKSMSGQQVMTQERELNTGIYRETIDINDLANGIYQLIIQSNGEFISRSVTVAR